MKRCMTSTEDEVEDGNLLEADALNSAPKKHPRLSQEVTTSKPKGDETIEIVEEIIVLDSDDEEATTKQNVLPEKRGPGRPPSEPTISNGQTSRAKYERQPTPVCDAIMREYSKRKRLAKLKGKDDSDFDDSFIKEIIEKHKRKNHNQKKSAVENVSANNNQSKSPSKDLIKADSKPKADKEHPKLGSILRKKRKPSQNDSLPITVNKDKDIKVVSFSKKKTKPTELKGNGTKALVTDENVIENENSEPPLPPLNVDQDVRADLKVNETQCKEDDSSRLSRKIEASNPPPIKPIQKLPSHLEKNQSNEETVQSKDSQNDSLPTTVNKDNDIKVVSCSKNKMKTKPTELKGNGIKALVTDKNVIENDNSDPPPPPLNIDQDDRADLKVNETKCKEDDSSWLPRKIEASNPSAIKPIKKFLSHLEKNQSNEETVQSKDSKPTKDAASHLKLVSESITSLLNNGRFFVRDDESHQLKTEKLLEFKHEKCKRNFTTDSIDVKMKNELSDHLENINSGFYSSNTIDSKAISLKLLNSSEVVSEKSLLDNVVQVGPSYLKNKFQFVMDYFTSYNDVFNSASPVFENDIPLMSEILLLCINDMKECLQRMKNAQSVSIIDLRHQEVQLAHQAYLNAVMSFGEKFFNVLDSIVQKIMESKTKKAIMITLIYFITNAIYTKEPTYRGQMHKVRDFLKMITITYKYYHPLILEVFEIPNHLYEEMLANLIKIMKNFYDRRFIQIPNDNLFVFWAEHFGKDQHTQSKDILLMDELVLELNIPSSIYEASHESSPKIPSFPTRQQNMPSYRISDVAAQLFKAMDTERDYTSKRIERKLDQLLSYLNDYDTQLPQEQPDEKLVKDESIKVQSQLPKILEVKHVGLDSLFTSYLSSTKCKVKTEPVKSNSNICPLNSQGTLQLNCNKSDGFYPVLENIKQEPEEHSKSPIFITDELVHDNTNFPEI